MTGSVVSLKCLSVSTCLFFEAHLPMADCILLSFHSGFMLPSQLTSMAHTQTAITSWKDSLVQICCPHLPRDALECVHLCNDRKPFCPGCTGKIVLVLRLEFKIASVCSSLFYARLFIWSRLPGSDTCYVQDSWIDIEDEAKLCRAGVSFATEFSIRTSSVDDADALQSET